MELRDYQAEALAAIHATPCTRQLVALPTGAGKTVLFATLTRDRGPNALVIAHRTELITQAAERLECFYPGNVGILQADRRDLDAPVLVASVQTAPRHLAALRLRNDRTLIIDEAHHAAAETYRHLVHALGFMAGNPDRLLLGVTATPNRADGIGLDCVFEQISYQKSILDLMDSGYLVDLRGIHVKTQTNLDTVRTTAGDFSTAELARAINTPERNRIIVEAFRDFGQVPAVAFCADIQHSLDLAEALTAAGYRAAAVTGQTHPDERAATLAALAAGDLDVVTNCNVLTEGFDCAALRCLLMARPTKSAALYTQMIGRGTRLHPGKTEALVLEFNDSRPEVCTLAALTGLPVKDKESVKEAHQADRERLASKPAPEVLAVTVEPFELFRRSAFNWYQNDRGNWVLKTAAGYIVVSRTKRGFWNVGTGKTWLSPAPFRTLPEALAVAERVAIEKKTA